MSITRDIESAVARSHSALNDVDAVFCKIVSALNNEARGRPIVQLLRELNISASQLGTVMAKYPHMFCEVTYLVLNQRIQHEDEDELPIQRRPRRMSARPDMAPICGIRSVAPLAELRRASMRQGCEVYMRPEPFKDEFGAIVVANSDEDSNTLRDSVTGLCSLSSVVVQE